jgi:hypothetical protein
MQKKKKPSYLKSRGYPHLTTKLDLSDSEIIAKVADQRFVANHDFFPLLHINIKERRFKKSVANGLHIRSHAFRDDQGRYVQNTKIRPLHYATHIDAVIFGYYAEILNKHYEKVLAEIPALSDCITAYRSLPHETLPRNKSTLDFAKDVFDEIKEKASDSDCVVLAFDLEKFFSSLNHKYLKKAWYQLLGKITLPPDHYNVYKASTNFSYILRDDLRIGKRRSGVRSGFNEKKIAQNRLKGIEAFFANVQELREKIKSKELPVYKNPFYDKERKVRKGIPQGLPISAVLANLYLLEFDTGIYQELVLKKQAYYRRYSDDIVIICRPEDCAAVEEYVNMAINQYFVSVSVDKTERFLFKKEGATNTIRSYKYTAVDKDPKRAPLLYLGFEFYGHKTLIKSSNFTVDPLLRTALG